MNFELTEQSIQFTFGNKKYKSGLKNRTFKNVAKDAQADALENGGVRPLPVCKTIHLMMRSLFREDVLSKQLNN